MKKSIKIISVLMIITTLLITTSIYSMAADETEQEITDKPHIEILADTTNYEQDKTIDITLSLKNMDKNISYLDAYVDYDENVFQEVDAKDFTNNLDEDTLSYFSYSKSAKKIVIEFTDDTKVDTICKLKLKVLDTVDSIDKAYIDINNASCYCYDDDETYDLGSASRVFEQKPDQPDQPDQPDKPDDKPDQPDNPDKDKLYLSSNVYKIGNNDIKNYENGDKYISRVTKETSLKDYINNLKTNGTIKVTKEDGTQLTEDELVGTGMTLIVTKDNEKIELKIAVSGDLNGDGKVTATDLSTLNQTVLKIVTLKDEYKIAADLDENDNITATDLSTENKMVLKLI